MIAAAVNFLANMILGTVVAMGSENLEFEELRLRHT